MKIWQLINFDCIYCQNFSMKTKFILDFFFIFYNDYCGAKEFGNPSPFHVKPKAHANEEDMSEDG